MLPHNLRTTLRRLRRQRLITLLNTVGMAIGFASCLLIGRYVQHEWSYDRYHANSERIVRLAYQEQGAEPGTGTAKVTYPWGDAAKAELPAVRERCRFLFIGQSMITVGDERFYESDGAMSDPSVFALFDWTPVRGDAATALAEPDQIVLTESLAHRCFGTTDVLGRTLQLDDDQTYRVSAVISDVPDNSHFQFSYLLPLSGYTHPDLHDWVRWNQFYTYLLLEPGTDHTHLASQFEVVLDRHLPADKAAEAYPLVQPLTDIHLHSDLHREIAANGNATVTNLFAWIGGFILLLAGLNFVNLTTAGAVLRTKDIGVRKILGASRPQLVRQYLSEAGLVTAIGALLGAGMAQLLLPQLNARFETELSFNWLSNPTFTLGFVATVVLMSLAAGSYPATVLANLSAERALAHHRNARRRQRLRNALVTAQFTVAAMLLVGALFAARQLRYIQQRDLGFSGEQVVVLPLPPDYHPQAERLRDELSRLPVVQQVTASANRPGGSDYGVPYRATGVAEADQPDMRCLTVDPQFLDTYDLELVAGRNFDPRRATDTAAYLLNETAVAELGWTDDPLSHEFSMPAVGRGPGPVIGVVRDFHFRSVHEKIAPLYIFYEPNWFTQLSVQLPPGQVDAGLTALETAWAEQIPEYPFDYFFFDERYGQLYRADRRTAAIVSWFSYVAVLITCLGLFGLAVYSMNRRRHEVSIRRVLGARTEGLLVLLTRDLLRPVAVALLLALPLSAYLVGRWLDNFAYRVGLDWWVFGLVAVGTLLLALLTVGSQGLRTAHTDPVESLRNE